VRWEEEGLPVNRGRHLQEAPVPAETGKVA
jgi:hypothetical protein